MAVARSVVFAVAVVVAMLRGGSGGGVGGGRGGGRGGGGGCGGRGVVSPLVTLVPPNLSTIPLIILSDKVIVLKKKYYRLFLCYRPSITTTTPLLSFVTLPPLPTILYPFHHMLIVGSLLFRHQRASANNVRTPSPHQRATTDAPTFLANALSPTPHQRRRVIVRHERHD